MSKYTIKAIVRPDLVIGKNYGGLPFTLSMGHLLSAEVMVRDLDGFYEEERETHLFSPQMITILKSDPLCEFLNYEKLKEHLLNGHSIYFPYLDKRGDIMATGFRLYLYYTDPNFPPCQIDVDAKGKRLEMKLVRRARK